jgi:hypothetical protein
MKRSGFELPELMFERCSVAVRDNGDVRVDRANGPFVRR